MNTNSSNQEEKQSADKKESLSPDNKSTHTGSDELKGEEIENPAAQSEAGPDIYDIGMGGPGASSSGLRNSNEEEDK